MFVLVIIHLLARDENWKGKAVVGPRNKGLLVKSGHLCAANRFSADQGGRTCIFYLRALEHFRNDARYWPRRHTHPDAVPRRQCDCSTTKSTGWGRLNRALAGPCCKSLLSCSESGSGCGLSSPFLWQQLLDTTDLESGDVHDCRSQHYTRFDPAAKDLRESSQRTHSQGADAHACDIDSIQPDHTGPG